jgi:hypothetical protein
MNSNDKNKKPTTEAMKGYDRTNRDFQRTENDLDDVSKSEKDALKEKAGQEKSDDKNRQDLGK